MTSLAVGLRPGVTVSVPLAPEAKTPLYAGTAVPLPLNVRICVSLAPNVRALLAETPL